MQLKLVPRPSAHRRSSQLEDICTNIVDFIEVQTYSYWFNRFFTLKQHILL